MPKSQLKGGGRNRQKPAAACCHNSNAIAIYTHSRMREVHSPAAPLFYCLLQPSALLCCRLCELRQSAVAAPSLSPHPHPPFGFICICQIFECRFLVQRVLFDGSHELGAMQRIVAVGTMLLLQALLGGVSALRLHLHMSNI